MLDIPEPYVNVNWCSISTYRTIYTQDDGSVICEQPSDYTMYMFEIDQVFNNGTYPITLSHIEPSVIKEGQGDDQYTLMVYGYGWSYIDSDINRFE